MREVRYALLFERVEVEEEVRARLQGLWEELVVRLVAEQVVELLSARIEMTVRVLERALFWVWVLVWAEGQYQALVQRALVLAAALQVGCSAAAWGWR